MFNLFGMAEDQPARVEPPDLILQAIVPPTDAPAEIRAAVADALARRRERHADSGHGWEDVSFAASAVALIKGTGQRAIPDTQWVFAISADSPRLGERVRSAGGWSTAIGARSHADGTSRPLWRAVVFSQVTTTPRF